MSRNSVTAGRLFSCGSKEVITRGSHAIGVKSLGTSSSFLRHLRGGGMLPLVLLVGSISGSELGANMSMLEPGDGSEEAVRFSRAGLEGAW